VEGVFFDLFFSFLFWVWFSLSFWIWLVLVLLFFEKGTHNQKQQQNKKKKEKNNNKKEKKEEEKTKKPHKMGVLFEERARHAKKTEKQKTRFSLLFLFAQAKLEIAPKSCPFRDEMKNTQKDLFSNKKESKPFLFFFKKDEKRENGFEE
jgi:type III secretory pathway component EscV